MTPATVPKTPAPRFKKKQTAFLQVRGSICLTAKCPPTHARRAKQLCPGENPLGATLGAHPVPPSPAEHP